MKASNDHNTSLLTAFPFFPRGTTTSRCSGNCLCEQKYTYHRLLSYDPDNDCKGIFIDWFLFPSCCACRCPP